MKRREEKIDDLILRSILGETNPAEEREIAEACSRQPDLLKKRRELAETTRLLSEAHGVPMDDQPTAQAPKPIWIRTLRAIVPIASGVAACLLFLALLVPQVGSVRQNQQDFDSIFVTEDFSSPESEALMKEEMAPAFEVPQESEESGKSRGQVSNRVQDESWSNMDSFAVPTNSANPGTRRRDLQRGSVASPARQLPNQSLSGGFAQSTPLGSSRERRVEADLSDFDDHEAAAGGERLNRQVAEREPLSEAKAVSSMSAPLVNTAPSAPAVMQAPAREPLPKKTAPKARPATPPVPAPTFTNPADDPFSTFSLNVTDVSFQLAAHQLAQGLSPNPASIRAEEFYNAFDYRDPAPPPGEPIRFEAESASLPAGQNLKVVRLSVKTASQGRAAGKPAQITFAIDHSGSMQRGDRKSTVNAALAQIPAALGPNDRVNIITFATNPRVELLQSSPNNRAGIGSALKFAPEGGTNLENGLTTAYEIATRYFDPAYENRVVLLSDGIANLGQTGADQLNRLIEKNRIKGIAFDGFGIGWENLNDPLLSELASTGDGRYAFLNSPEDAGNTFAHTLAGSLQSSIRDVKVQVEWNADRVESFRLVGYETHLLTKEEFRDDTIDAAEMAPDQAGNAIYLVELKADGEGPLGTARVRFKEERGADSGERTWIIPNPPVWPEIDAASPSLQLATSAAIFAEKLQNADRFPTINRSQLLTWVQKSQAYFNSPPKVETLAMMIRNATFLP